MTLPLVNKPTRRVIQVTMQPDLYELVRQRCKKLDVPMTVWARELIKHELARRQQND